MKALFNTLPYNYFPASTAKFEEGKNDAIQAEIDAIKDGTNIDSFGDVETALSLKVNSADMETALATKTNLSNIAPTFDSESGTYDIGEQVIYEGVLYEFISAHDTPGDWDSTEVQAVKISELIDTLNSNLANKTDYQYYNKETSASEEDAIKDLYDSLNIYDKTVVGTLNYHGFWMFMALKYTGGSFGSIVLYRFDGTAKFLKVYEGVKSIKTFTFDS